MYAEMRSGCSFRNLRNPSQRVDDETESAIYSGYMWPPSLAWARQIMGYGGANVPKDPLEFARAYGFLVENYPAL